LHKGQKIQFYRKQNSLTQGQLSKGICSITYLSKLENGNLEPNEEILDLLCKRLGISFDLINTDVNESSVEDLKRWYRVINSRDIGSASKCFLDIKEKYSNNKDPFIKSTYLLFLFRYYLLLRDLKEADKVLIELKKYESYYSNEYSYYYSVFIGLFYYLSGQYQLAIDYYIEAGSHNPEDPDYYFQTALTYSRLQKVSLSLIQAKKALERYSQQMNYTKCQDCNLLIGINNNILGDYKYAQDIFETMLEQHALIAGNKSLKAKIYHNLGYSYGKQGFTEKAIDFYKKSLQLKQHDKEKLTTLYQLAIELYNLNPNSITLILETINEGSKISKELNDKYYLYQFKLIKYQVEKNDNSEDFKNFLENSALPYFESHGDLDKYYECCELIGNYYKNKFQYKLATHYFELALKVRKTYSF